MFNPFKKLQSELQNDLQAAIKHLGPSFTHEGTDIDENANTILHWSFFGTNGDGFYHVSVYSNTSHDGWVCNGATIVPASALDFSPLFTQEDDNGGQSSIADHEPVVDGEGRMEFH